MSTPIVTLTNSALRRHAYYTKYVEYIQRCCRRPGIRAALRSGLRRTPEQALRMHAVLTRHLPSGVTPAEERAYYTVAALIASQSRAGRDDQQANEAAQGSEEPDSASRPNGPDAPRRSLGRSLAELNDRTRSRQRVTGNGDEHDGFVSSSQSNGHADKPDGPLSPIERRLHLLSRQSLDGLHRQLPAVVLRLRDERIEVDWVQLLDDLIQWPSNSGRITKRWMQDYYRSIGAPSGNDTPTGTSSSKGSNE